MQLISPTKEYAESWHKALNEFEAEEIKGFWNVPTKPTDIDEYIHRTKAIADGTEVPDNWVPATTFWLMDAGEFVGHVNIRHTLNDWLQNIGGHIGYSIRPSKQGQGYGTKILELALLEAKALGIDRALVTCDDANVASQKIIERNGGKHQDTHDVDGKMVRRYWIEL